MATGADVTISPPLVGLKELRSWLFRSQLELKAHRVTLKFYADAVIDIGESVEICMNRTMRGVYCRI